MKKHSDTVKKLMQDYGYDKMSNEELQRSKSLMKFFDRLCNVLGIVTFLIIFSNLSIISVVIGGFVIYRVADLSIIFKELQSYVDYYLKR